MNRAVLLIEPVLRGCVLGRGAGGHRRRILRSPSRLGGAEMASADFEAFEVLWGFFDYFDSIDASHLGALGTEIDHLVDGVCAAFEDGFDASVCEVAHPTVYTCANGVLCGRCAEPDVLHESGNQHPTAAAVRRFRGTHSLPSGA